VHRCAISLAYESLLVLALGGPWAIVSMSPLCQLSRYKDLYALLVLAFGGRPEWLSSVLVPAI